MHSFIKKGYQLRVDRKIGRIKISQPRFNPSSMFTKYLTEGNTLLHLKQSRDFFKKHPLLTRLKVNYIMHRSTEHIAEYKVCPGNTMHCCLGSELCAGSGQSPLQLPKWRRRNLHPHLKGLSVKAMVSPVVMYRCELDHNEG